MKTIKAINEFINRFKFHSLIAIVLLAINKFYPINDWVFIGIGLIFLDKLFWDSIGFIKYEQKSLSRPYIISVTKNTKKDVMVTLFDAANSVLVDNFNQDESIKIESDIPDTSYKQILWKLTQSQYRIGETWIQCLNEEQIVQPLKVIYNNFRGDILSHFIYPKLNVKQNIRTQLTFNDYINASAELNIQFKMLADTDKITFAFYSEKSEFIYGFEALKQHIKDLYNRKLK